MGGKKLKEAHLVIEIDEQRNVRVRLEGILYASKLDKLLERIDEQMKCLSSLGCIGDCDYHRRVDAMACCG